MPSDVTRRQVLAGVATACGTAVGATSATRAGTDPPTDRGDATASGRSADLAAAVRRAAERALSDHDADGATVAVVADGATVLTEGFGHAYLNPDVPVDPDDTLFRIGSVSKVFPYVAAMRLVDEGRADPNAPVSELLESVSVPDADAYDEPVTLAHLATHTAGFEECAAGQFRSSSDDLRSLPDALRANDPERIHPPGELPLYTNYNAGLAGQLVADVSGTNFASAVRRLVFDPLGMDASTFEPLPAALVGGRSDAAEEIYWYSEMTPASGMSATATDMARFVRAVVGDGAVDDGRVLSPEAVEALHRQWYTPHERLAGASFGMERQRRDGTLVVGHEGGVPDFSTDLRLLPEEGIGLFVSAHGSEAGDVQSAVTRAFLDHVAPVTEPERPSGDAPARADELAGTYQSALLTDAASFEKPLFAMTKPTVSVRVADEGALVTEERGTSHRWVATAPRTYRRTDGEDALVFRETDDGDVRLFRASEPRATFERVPWYGQLEFQGRLAGVAGLVVLSGALGWPGAAAWRRFRDESASAGELTSGRWAAGVAALALVAFLVTCLVGIANYWLYVRPPWFDLVFALPAAGSVVSLVAAGVALRAWRRGRGSIRARAHVTAVVAGLTVLYGLLRYWNLLRLPL